MGFISKFGKLASKLYREIYKKDPEIKRRPLPGQKRWPVHRYPCGILEQAYRQLREQGVPLVKKGSALAEELVLKEARRLEHFEQQWLHAWKADDAQRRR
jgi:hypothetical protein